MSKKNRRKNRKQNKNHNQQEEKNQPQSSTSKHDEITVETETNNDIIIDDENDETNTKPSERSSLLEESEKTKKQQRRNNNNEPTTTTTTSTSEKEIVNDQDNDDDDYVAEPEDDDDESSESSSDDDDDDSLVLEGMMQRVDGVESSSDSEESSDEEEEKDTKPPPKKKSKINNNDNNQQQNNKSLLKKKSSKDSPGDDITNVEFIFCDMNEKFFHGLKTFLASSPIHAPHSSSLSDLLIDNISVGTVISTDDEEHNVFGFASVLNITSHLPTQPSIATLVELCQTHCPQDKKGEMDVVLSGRTKRPAGFLIHDRMVNLPLEITEVLHKQLVLDMEWAVDNATGGEEERKSLDFGVLVRLAPAVRGGQQGGVVYKHFDDEVFATNAEFVYDFDVTGRGMFGVEQKKEVCVVIVMTRSGHERAMKELATMIHG